MAERVPYHVSLFSGRGGGHLLLLSCVRAIQCAVTPYFVHHGHPVVSRRAGVLDRSIWQSTLPGEQGERWVGGCYVGILGTTISNANTVRIPVPAAGEGYLGSVPWFTVCQGVSSFGRPPHSATLCRVSSASKSILLPGMSSFQLFKSGSGGQIGMMLWF